MSRAVVALTGDVLDDLPDSVRRCAYWELDPVERSTKPADARRQQAKQAWLSATLLEWGSCGQVVYLDDRPAGFLLYAPPAFVPSSDSFATSPAAGDAVLLMTGQVFRGHERAGLGRLLIQSMAKDLVRRRVRAVEVFGARRPTACTGDPRQACLLPTGFLSHVGFRTVRQHPVSPRMRMDLRATVSWRSDVEHAVDRLLGSIRTAPHRAMNLSDEL